MDDFSKKLVEWYKANRRNLPWRESRDPYKVWISEIMLQQTTVRAVIPYYQRFLHQFPNVKTLANASVNEVEALWSGLGYYSRARNLHSAAQQVLTQHKGKMPKTAKELLKLKGIGRYTAAAIASICYGEPVVVVDGNVLRVISRIFDLTSDISQITTQENIRSLAQNLMEDHDPSLFNQSLMELGATICTPKSPSCMICPVHSKCRAFLNSTVNLRPIKTKKTKQEKWLWKIHILEKQGKLALVRGTKGAQWLKSTWVLPGEARRIAKCESWDFKHSITKHEIFVRITKSKSKMKFKNLNWIKPEDLPHLGVSSVVHKALAHLNKEEAKK